MTINSRDKGCRGERQVAQKLREYGFEAKRGQQHNGADGSPDVITNMKGIHIEVKYTERLNLYDALEQSKRDARQGEMPIVVHRRNNCEWVVIQPLEHWIELYKDYLPL